jgi:pantoate--beta-alanine ligase
VRTSILRTGGEVGDLVGLWRSAGESVALVPTMGNLHDGHLSLARLAATQADRVLMTIFVNRTQFAPGEDFGAYPRTLDADLAAADAAGVVDAMFAPDEREIYPYGTDDAVTIGMPSLASELCGAARPGHFNGVGSVIVRLLNITTPHLLVLGRKDYQQLILVERLLADLRYKVRVVRGEIRREADGLAMSSRNRYLSEAERARAPALQASLRQVSDALTDGQRNYAALAARAVAALKDAGLRPDYVEIRRAGDLGQPGPATQAAELIVLGAAWLGRARLIDNVPVQPEGG